MNIKKIKIGGHVVDIYLLDKFDNVGAEIGLCIPPTNTIKLSKTYMGDKLHEQALLDSLIHEVCHFIDFVYCGYVLEEDVIKNLAKYLIYVFNKNDILNFPDTIDFMGYIYEVEYNCNFSESLENIAINTNRLTQVISVGSKNVNNEIACDNYIIVNIIIGILSIINREYIEDEVFVKSLNTFAQGLYQVLIDNKTFYNMFKWGK